MPISNIYIIYKKFEIKICLLLNEVYMIPVSFINVNLKYGRNDARRIEYMKKDGDRYGQN